MICSKCGAQLSDNAVSCDICGTPTGLQQVPVEPVPVTPIAPVEQTPVQPVTPTPEVQPVQEPIQPSFDNSVFASSNSSFTESTSS